MGRASELLDSFQRVLRLAERALARAVGPEFDPAVFETVHVFRWEVVAGAGRLVPVQDPATFDLDDLLGIDSALAKLVRNTEQFVRGLPANHVLLFGERGTGKSSAVKGLVPRFGERGLRLVEVHKADLMHLPEVVALLRGQPYRFLLFCDDLSFDHQESSYRELKAALEGSVEAPPENVRVVATSNRRHLMPELRSDSAGAHLDEDGELRMGEAVEEKLALSDRFGLLLGFYGFKQPTYLEIVEHYAKQAGLEVPPDRLRAEALRFALDRSSRSGRTARQFVDDLAGSEALARQTGKGDGG